MKKISHKITATLVASLLIVTLLLGAISLYVSARVVRFSTEKNLSEAAERLAEQLNNSTRSIEIKLEDLAMTIADDVDLERMKTDPTYPDEYTEKIIPLVTAYAESGEINVDCYVNFLNEYSKDGFIIGPNIINADGKGFRRVNFETKVADMVSSPKDYDWYYIPIQQKSGYWTDPYYDVITNLYMVSYVTPIFIEGNVEGVVGMDIQFDTLRNIVNEAKIYETGYASLLDSNFNFLVHPTFGFEENLKTVYEGTLLPLAESIEKNKAGVYLAEVDGTKKYIGYSKMQNGNILLVSVAAKEVLTDVYQLAMMLVLITIFGIIFSIYVSVYISKRISDPITSLSESAMRIANGQLDVTIPIETQDEIGQFAKTFNYMINALLATNTELTAVFEELTATEEELRNHYDLLKESEAALRLSDERYQLAVDGANDIIWEIEVASGTFYASSKLYELLGVEQNSFNSILELNRFIHPEDFEVAKNELYQYIAHQSNSYQSTYRVIKANGEYIWFFSRGKAIWGEDGTAVKVAGSISDITEKKIIEDKINFLAYHDDLTKLPNRYYFIEKLDAAIKASLDNQHNGSVYYIDLDNFKVINDTLGHSFGDRVLIYLTEILKGIVDPSDVLCRLGGDEFVLIHTDSTDDDHEVYVNRIIESFREIKFVEGKQVYITTSIGVAVFPKDGVNSDDILKNADFAMYKAKESGKNKYHIYNEAMFLQLERKTKIERILHGAMSNQELSVVYQPQYRSDTRTIFGFEALIRLNSKELGFISPAEFIPIAEESGTIVMLDQWIFKAACEQAQQWYQAGYHFESISINVSSIDLMRTDFVENVEKIISETGILPTLVEIEITETAVIEYLETVSKRLQRLRDLGVRIALDDFGTGYSSLSYLRSIPIDTLKVDKSFIDHIAENANEEAIIHNIIQMAHTMELKVVAEGVETKEQYEILEANQCDYIQGYYFGRPLSAKDIERLFLDLNG